MATDNRHIRMGTFRAFFGAARTGGPAMACLSGDMPTRGTGALRVRAYSG